MRKNPEKVALILVALVALGFGVKHLLAVQGYAQTFELPDPVRKGQAIPETPDALVEKSTALVELPLFWTDKKIEIPGSTAAKEVPLLRSVYIVEKDGKLFDLANPNTEPLRPPVPNTWILGHQLEILNPKVLQMDADSDGFTNLEEFEAKTNPLKNDSHPSYTDKLFFAARPQIDMVLRFAVNSNPDFQVVLQTRARTITKIYRLGQTFPENQQFTLLKFNDKKDPTGKDISELEVRDNQNKKTVVLPLRNPVPWPIYAVDFEFPLGRTADEQKFRVREGNTFHLSLDPGTEYRLESADADSATIRKAGAAEPMVIRKRPEGAAAPAAGEAAAPLFPAPPPLIPGSGSPAVPAAPAGTAPAAPAGTAPAAPVKPAAAVPAGAATPPVPAGAPR